MKTLTLLLLALTACDELVEQLPDAETADSATTDAPRAWPTSALASVALCSPYCRWLVRCEATFELTACEVACEAELGTDGVAPAGTDETIDSCVRTLHLESMSPYFTCDAGGPHSVSPGCITLGDGTPCDEVPHALTPQCVDAVRARADSPDPPVGR